MTLKYESRLVIIVRETSKILHVKDHIALSTLADEAERGAVLVWDHNGLFYLMCNAALRNYARTFNFSGINLKVKPLVTNEFVMINPKLAKLILE